MAEPAFAEDKSRDLDPNVRQRRAADPLKSVCVGASAGTGKTKVLTDRVLRLLLPGQNGQPGTKPGRILCLTFTKAGASEMLQRINKILGKWAVLSDAALEEDLQKLTGAAPTKEDIQAARQLFASVVDTPGGLKIMTIHSFCQSVLGRFPLEAGLPPQFSVIDEPAAQEFLANARDQVLIQARNTPDSALGNAIRNIATEQNEEQFGKLLRSLCSERLYLQTKTNKPDILHEKLCACFDITPEDTVKSFTYKTCEESNFDKAGLYRACGTLAEGGKTDQERGLNIQPWLEATTSNRAAQIIEYQSQFLTKKNEIKKTLVSKKIASAHPDIEAVLVTEAERLLALQDKLKAVKCAGLTRDLMLFGQEIIKKYQKLKDKSGQLDYDDLILKTLALLEHSDMAQWVLYKLDSGLDHILIDEAQDTNPEQWQIIQKLCEDFFSGQGAKDNITRTIFTVGDEKQSIYSFQRAAPREFEKMRQYFADKAGAQEEKLVISFRSTKSVLELVDEVFAPPELRQGLGKDDLEHHSFRRGQAGLVELWPLISPDEMPEEEPWAPPVNIIKAASGQAKLADHIGETIKDWLDKGEELESLGRAIMPGDIMILVRTRTAFVGQLVRALKTRNIPVSGVDRMVLGEQIAVMDLLALAQFALLPDDDLSLACALKSPLIGLDEDQLYDLAIDRNATLWEVLKKSDHKDIVHWLKNLITHAKADHPYEFFSRILQTPCPADTTSGLRGTLHRLGNDALDPLNEFLNAALSYERDNIPALQGFLVWQNQGDITIKRELEEAGQAVRIMTIHGAKGLQAPVVILPDTTRTSSAKKIDSLLWPDKTELEVPLWSPRSKDFPALYQQARARLEDYLEEEYKRLLYVALTRAEDRLYIGGYKGKREPVEECWYNYIARAFERLPDVQEEAGVKRFTNPQTASPDRPDDTPQKDKSANIDLPGWLFKKAPSEPSPPQPLIPSRPLELEPAIRSPLDSAKDSRFQRGNITHKLLQILPDLPQEERRKAAEHFTAQPGHKLSGALQQDITNETMTILENPDYEPLFGPGSMAEVPITGLMKGRLISAQLDRILITEEEIMVVDYKTNRPPPENERDIPEIYRAQMKSYRDIVATIYPGKAIKCFLLWTDGPVLMPLENI